MPMRPSQRLSGAAENAQELSRSYLDGAMRIEALWEHATYGPSAAKQAHDAMGKRYRAGLLLAAFAGLRLSEVCRLQRL